MTAVIALSTLSTVSTSNEMSKEDLKKWISSKAGWRTEDNVAYPGGDLKDWKGSDGWNKWSAMEDAEKTAEACRALCEEEKEANFFTFRKTNKNCWCKETKGKIGGKNPGPKKDEDAISGSSHNQGSTTESCMLAGWVYNWKNFFQCADGKCIADVCESNVLCTDYKCKCDDNSDKILKAYCG